GGRTRADRSRGLRAPPLAVRHFAVRSHHAGRVDRRRRGGDRCRQHRSGGGGTDRTPHGAGRLTTAGTGAGTSPPAPRLFPTGTAVAHLISHPVHGLEIPEGLADSHKRSHGIS